ncbi:hybrid sensor histidine kinase/response regulator [Dasania marina]|uniref:PAS domain-containing hybrid sensor histidine kinase/response regulator n=1 Tax=Dasania marina TaxID=471499 RepID=UPI0030DCACB2|tara:strand:+ start:160759 stop:164295 length:3537 start_codon:yes stop_codon:yes gene_type:complete
MDSQLLLLCAFIYAAILFYIAWRSEFWQFKQAWVQPVLYSLSLAVYCSSWTFLGAVGQAVDNGWSFLPIYLGPILLFLLGWRFLRRLLVISSRNKVTSIADFIGSRYGKSQSLAAIVTLVAVLGSLPYIALQLKAVSLVWSTIQLPIVDGVIELSTEVNKHGSSFVTALVMACFAILFGTRVIDGPHRHQGMITTIAFESLVKIIVFFIIGLLAIQLLVGDGVERSFSIAPLIENSRFDLNFVTQSFLAMVAVVCLPRQFHVMVVEYHSRKDIRTARWLFPLYLALISLIIVPIAIASQQLLSHQQYSSDAYVLLLPMMQGSQWLTSLAFIGAISAATGMVVVAAVTLSIMISNELVVPLWLWLSSRSDMAAGNLGERLRLVRRISIVVVLLLAWLLELNFSQSQALASIGLISFAAAAQLMPAIIGALYWQRGHRNGVLTGLMLGVFFWFYCFLLPSVLGQGHSLVLNGPWHLAWLSPINLLGTGGMGQLSHGVFWSLLFNFAGFIMVSKYSRFNSLDLRQANSFTQLRRRYSFQQYDFDLTGIEVRQLQTLLQPLLEPFKYSELWREFEVKIGRRLLPLDKAPRFVVKVVEDNLAAIIGAVSAHKAVELLRKQKPVQIEDFVSLMGGRSRQLQFDQNLLQVTLETIPQGVSVVDGNLNLVAWNERYQAMFDYPPRLLYVGCPIAKVYYFNAERGYLGEGDHDDIDGVVEKRLNFLRQAEIYKTERELPNGMVVEISGIPIENGGYVTTYMDVTKRSALVDELIQTKLSLESRVIERTAELSLANQSLKNENKIRAKIEKELSSVHRSKSNFLAASSHDLLQPINAARLFVATMQQKTAAMAEGDKNIQSIKIDVDHIDSALSGAENLIESMREVARLDSGKLVPKRENFAIADVLEMLAREFGLLAQKTQLDLHWVPCKQWVYSDKHLLRRIVQNFLSNALRYTRRGKVLLGCRIHKDSLDIEVWDTGAGIAEKDRKKIFEEFERLGDGAGIDGQKGLGLGLSIANRMAKLLGYRLSFESELGKGSVFRINVPLGVVESKQKVNRQIAISDLRGLRVLCVDNEQQILNGMRSLLEQWGCFVCCAFSLGSVLELWKFDGAPDVILVDYHLDDGETGLQVLEALGLHWGVSQKAIVISADNSDDLREEVHTAGYLFLPKPVQPAALRGLVRKLSRKKS